MSYFSNKRQEYQALDARDRRRFWTDGLLNNALYILMALFIIYTAVKNPNFVKPGSIVNMIQLAAVSLPMALGIGGCIVLAHPFRVRDYVSKISLNTCVHAVEAFNRGNLPQDDIYGLAFAEYGDYPVTAGSDMHLIEPGRELYGVVFDEPWEDIFSYARAIRERKPFGVRTPPGRGCGRPDPLQRPYE